MSETAYTRFANRIKEHDDEAVVIHEGCWHEGPRLIRACMNTAPGWRGMSLRKLAAATKCSATYLSMVQTGKTVMSPAVFVRLAAWLEKQE